MAIGRKGEGSLFERLGYQWDKAVDAVPVLRPAVSVMCVGMGAVFCAFVLPAMIMPENEHRSLPEALLREDTFMPDELKQRRADRLTQSGGASPYDKEKTRETTGGGLLGGLKEGRRRKNEDPAPRDKRDDVPRVIFPEHKNVQAESSAQPRKLYVSVLNLNADGGPELILNAGRYVDPMDVREINKYVHKLTLKSPVDGFEDIVNLDVEIAVLRHQITRCLYYKAPLFGAVRIIEAPDQEAGAQCY